MISHTLSYDDRMNRRAGERWRGASFGVSGRSCPTRASSAEPFVSLIPTAFGFLGIVVALNLKLSGELAHFPFWLMMAFAIGAVLLLMAYHAPIGLFS